MQWAGGQGKDYSGHHENTEYDDSGYLTVILL